LILKILKREKKRGYSKYIREIAKLRFIYGNGALRTRIPKELKVNFLSKAKKPSEFLLMAFSFY